MAPTYTLPADFLSGPAPNLIVEPIDWTSTALFENKGLYATLISNALTASECDTLVRAAEAQCNGVWEQAMINVGGGMQELAPDVRNCGRIIWDDRDVVAKIWDRVKDAVLPEIGVLEGRPGVTG